MSSLRPRDTAIITAPLVISRRPGFPLVDYLRDGVSDDDTCFLNLFSGETDGDADLQSRRLLPGHFLLLLSVARHYRHALKSCDEDAIG